MKKNLQVFLKEYEDIMKATSAIYYFRLANICVKADPVALLSTTVEIDGMSFDIEDVASVALPTEQQFAIYPNELEHFIPIAKAIKIEHPEFEIRDQDKEESEGGVTPEERKMLGIPDPDPDTSVDKYLLCTMPKVDEDRRKIYNDLTESLIKPTKADLEKTKVQFTTLLTGRTIGLTKEQIEELQAKIDSVYDEQIEACENCKANKQQEIEDAYQLYLKEQTSDEATDDKQQDNAGMKMQMGQE